MSTQLDGYVGILVQQFYQLVESLSGLGAQCSFVEVIMDIVYQYWSCDAGQRELQHIFLRLLYRFDFQVLLMIQETLAGS